MVCNSRFFDKRYRFMNLSPCLLLSAWMTEVHNPPCGGLCVKNRHITKRRETVKIEVKNQTLPLGFTHLLSGLLAAMPQQRITHCGVFFQPS